MADESLPVPPAKPDLPDIVRRYLNGESVQTIAQNCHVHRQTIYRWMMAGRSDSLYYDLVTDALINRIADADWELEKAETKCDIARSREQCRYSRLDFERRRPELYGPKQEHQHKAVVVIVEGQTPQQVVDAQGSDRQQDASPQET